MESAVKPEALEQLVELGVEKSTAHEALLKYNNDVNRAADFYFQNFQNNFQSINSDDPTNILTTLTEWDSDTPRNDSDNNTSTIDLTGNDPELNNAIIASIKDQDEDDLKRGINESLKETSPRPSSAVGNDDNSNMAVVLYKADVNKNDNNLQAETPWLGPEQPIKRVKLDTTPLGLKPILRHGYTCSFFQALFHIPVFRLAILAYRPTRSDWGEVDGYWNGKSQGLSIEDDVSMDSYSPESKFKSRQFTMKFMHEFQKIFGFLSLSQRTYGDARLLMNALEYEETKKGWGEWEDVIQDFVTRMLDAIVGSLSYRDLIDLDFGISDSLSKYIIPFDKLLKSDCRNEYFRNYDAHYQPEKKDEEILNIPLEITPNRNTIYAALDQLSKPMQKVFFINPAKILILNIKHRDGYADNSFTSGDPVFHIDKELYMDRYLLDRAEDIEKRWCQLEDYKSEFEKINQAIRNITEYQGRHNGSDLLKGSIDYFRRKCDKARNIDVTDEVAQDACFFLEGVLEKVEQKLKVLLEKREEIETKMKDIFDTPDMKKVVYRLKAVLLSDGQYGQEQYYAYIWVSRGNKTETISSNNENGTWWKFCDTNVEEKLEEQVFKDTPRLHTNSGVHTLIYVNADVDYNFPNINDLIPTSLKEYVERDNRVLDEVVSNPNNGYPNNDYDYPNNDYDYPNNDYDYPNNDYDYHGYSNNDDEYTNATDGRDLMDTSGETDSYKNIEGGIDIPIQQADHMGPLNPKINIRFEVFCIKLEQIDLFKSLMHKYYDSSHVGVSWDEPCPLNEKYRYDPYYKEYVNLFSKYKEITLCFTEGLERVNCDEYRNALAYFKYAINLENDWINHLNITDNEGKLVALNGEKLRRSREIDAYARACLKVEHEGFLGKIRYKKYITRGLKDGLQILPYIVGYIGALNCSEDKLFIQFKDEFHECLKIYDEFTKEQKELIDKLNEEYMRPKESLELKPIEDIEDVGDNNSLYERYESALKLSSSSLKKYDEKISNRY